MPSMRAGPAAARVATARCIGHARGEPEGLTPTPQQLSLEKRHRQYHELGRYITNCLPKYIQQFSVYKDELTLCVAPNAIVQTCTFLRDHVNCQFTICTDIAGADYPGRSNRFEVVYHLQSPRFNQRVRVKTYANESSAVPSVVPIWPGANWFERECYDMFGVFFTNHPDLRRILTDYGFEGHPLRKDFPLTGYTELRYDEDKKRVVYEPLELAQAFRRFDAQSPWEPHGDGVRVPKLTDPQPAATEPLEAAKKP
ncbi:hypothetical protein CXG81DRAFT_29931 [Caulochytrium protostelioides]|uniref:NADH:ubiquinone oxidoreductase 30kDa subunit domain-containing protein n=1 Tax=Caulochytrium protostelioides TaxID=1555241 RepID=A0A4P9X620_9FUNG|nr:hypothetical protein CXG81DRAFT_29931 [Caulochytrium protostelioides]|eukprot:RKP00616.1 hypothetical protein CXG81DRAFT_29931 [Caulochytrium protostelioides]